MKIYEGEEIETYKTETLGMQASWGKRDFVNAVKNYLDTSVEKILVITGIKGVGNTVGILQAAEGYDVAYLLIQKDDSETGRDYINFLKSTEKKVIIIDEYSWIKDRKDLDYYLLTSVQDGKRIVLTATESITLYYLRYGRLNHRIRSIFTTMFTYEEYLKLYNKENSDANFRNYLMNGSLFKNYILNNFDSLTDFINKSIVANIAGYFMENGRMSKEKVKVLTYAVLYKAICPSNLSKITNLNESHITLKIFLDKMGIPTEYIPEDHEIWQIADILEDVGIIVRIPDFDEESKFEKQYYIANPSLTYWLIKEIYGNSIPENDILSHIFESYVAVRLFTNMLSEHRIYFYGKNVQEKKEKLFIVTDIEKYHTYLFECKFKQTDSSDSDITLLSGYPDEHEFKDGEIEGRYVVCNRTPVVKTYSVGTVIFTTPGDVLDNYFQFNKNVNDILQRCL